MIVTVEAATPTLSAAEQAWLLYVWRTAYGLRDELARADRSLVIILLACTLHMPTRYVRGAVGWLERCGHLRATEAGYEVTPVAVARKGAG